MGCCQLASEVMDCSSAINYLKGSLCHQIILFTILLRSFRFMLALQSSFDPDHLLPNHGLSNPPSSKLFKPIEISPAVIPNFKNPEPFSPSYPSFPSTYTPVLTGRCPVNFAKLSGIIDKTASDCFQNFAAVVADAVCCPQFSSLLHIFQGHLSSQSDKLVLESAVAIDCLKDITSILASRRANNSICTICSIKSSNLTGGSCPVKDVATFENLVSTKKLLLACGIVDPLKECCRPVCYPAIMEAAFQISRKYSAVLDHKGKIRAPNNVNLLNDCMGVVYSWLSRKLPLDSANTAFRLLSSCNVNRVCPLGFKEPTEVIKACGTSAPGPSCCSSLHAYIAGMERKVLITNKQAIVCATMLGSVLQKSGLMTNLYELCDVDLKDFSVQAYGQQAAGCLLRSEPADMVFDNATGLTFMCDLSDNIAPWPSSSVVTSLSFCAPEMSLPALPTAETLKNHGDHIGGFGVLVWILLCLILSAAS